ncbi:uncharacterized protein LOC106059388 [Biomphalaria glabrata]|uniref:Uncharacterized protein LOC106059388 n=1 Tax=Biomphalaria glabrata TaxID=6526 RepID=A0A9W3ACS7_BIOGL|nr:uncharacterized protein LOC106059388 [Biomphalaria glabrata]XP_055884983.1 uncharacterized protein LOC106059388 [Biomphalaria glabrata]XP_055884984.1 uncharacterized protein LOC106059388 [Biomphalaria glabrata]
MGCSGSKGLNIYNQNGTYNTAENSVQQQGENSPEKQTTEVLSQVKTSSPVATELTEVETNEHLEEDNLETENTEQSLVNKDGRILGQTTEETEEEMKLYEESLEKGEKVMSEITLQETTVDQELADDELQVTCDTKHTLRVKIQYSSRVGVAKDDVMYPDDQPAADDGVEPSCVDTQACSSDEQLLLGDEILPPANADVTEPACSEDQPASGDLHLAREDVKSASEDVQPTSEGVNTDSFVEAQPQFDEMHHLVENSQPLCVDMIP